MTEAIREDLLHILQHSLGLDDYGSGDPYRNHFSSGPDCDHYALCRELVGMGLMVERGPRPGVFPDSTFFVTDAGRLVVQEQSPTPPKISRSKRRYREWLAADGAGMTFGEWIRRSPEVIR